MAFAQEKYVLVIGNAKYSKAKMLREPVPSLMNPVKDAEDVKTALETLDWNVTIIPNGDRIRMEDGIKRLETQLSGSKESYGLLYYSGQGVQANGVNYLIPVDAQIPSEAYLPNRTISVSTALRQLWTAGNILNIVVVDAGRSNPFIEGAGGSGGFAPVSGMMPGSIVVYAGNADDNISGGASGGHGLFTEYLLKNLKTPGLEVYELFRRTGADVQVASKGTQIPEVYIRFFQLVYMGQASNRR